MEPEKIIIKKTRVSKKSKIVEPEIIVEPVVEPVV